jgi:DNA-binding LacI/PurR family transcriptional regulator
VVAFDDTGLARVADPPLTTIATPREELGMFGFRLLQEAMQTSDRPRRSAAAAAMALPTISPERGGAVRTGRLFHAQTILPVKLVVRSSTAQARP